MQVSKTPLRDLLLIQPAVFKDERGYFFESFNAKKLQAFLPEHPFVQDNEALSSRGVLRGLHYQVAPFAQAKLVRVIRGEVLDVAVDIRPDSPTYGKWYSHILSGENKTQMYVPRGFAHGYFTLSEKAVFSYKCDDYYSREHEGGIRYDDPSLKIDWQIGKLDPALSEKDVQLPLFGEHRPFT